MIDRQAVRVLPELSTLQSGDLLLFASTFPFTLPVRIAFSTSFSHIGVCVRRADGLYVLESMPFHGVTLYPLQKRVEELGIWYPLLCGRRLVVSELDPDSQTPSERLTDLVDQFVGKSYEWNIPKLAASLLLRQWQESTGFAFPLIQNPAVDDSVSCSELVALVYQGMGLLPAQPQAQQYHPGHFLQQPLTSGAHLGPQFTLAFRVQSESHPHHQATAPGVLEAGLAAAAVAAVCAAVMSHRRWYKTAVPALIDSGHSLLKETLRAKL